MPEIVWQPSGPTTHTIPTEWNDTELGTIVLCDCGQFAKHDKDDYGVDRWRHLYLREILFYRIFTPERLGLNAPIRGRDAR